MAVTSHDVRVALNDITQDELTDDTILQKITDAEADAANQGITGNRFIRELAAYRSFLVSRSYIQAKVGDIMVRRDLKMFADTLLQNVKDAADGGYEKIAIKATPMFDDRPEDPNEQKSTTTE